MWGERQAEPPRGGEGQEENLMQDAGGTQPSAPGQEGQARRVFGAAPRGDALFPPPVPPPAALPHTYVPLVVHLVVGELHPVEADDLPHPGLPRAGGVGVDVEPRGDAGVVRVPRHHPLRAVIDVPGPARAAVRRRRPLPRPAHARPRTPIDSIGACEPGGPPPPHACATPISHTRIKCRWS